MDKTEQAIRTMYYELSKQLMEAHIEADDQTGTKLSCAMLSALKAAVAVLDGE